MTSGVARKRCQRCPEQRPHPPDSTVFMKGPTPSMKPTTKTDTNDSVNKLNIPNCTVGCESGNFSSSQEKRQAKHLKSLIYPSNRTAAEYAYFAGASLAVGYQHADGFAIEMADGDSCI